MSVCQVLARSSPDDKHLLVTRLNGTALPRDRSEWEELHPELDWNVDRDRALPGYWDEVGLGMSWVCVSFAAAMGYVWCGFDYGVRWVSLRGIAPCRDTGTS